MVRVRASFCFFARVVDVKSQVLLYDLECSTNIPGMVRIPCDKFPLYHTKHGFSCRGDYALAFVHPIVAGHFLAGSTGH